MNRAKDLYLRYNDRPCNKPKLTYDPLNRSHQVYCGAVAQVGKCIGVCGYQILSVQTLRTLQQSPQSMKLAVSMKFDFSFSYSLFSNEAIGLCRLLFVDCKGMKVPCLCKHIF